MKKLMILVVAVLTVSSLVAQSRKGKTSTSRKGRAAASVQEAAPTGGAAEKVILDQFPKVGRGSTLSAPSIPGATIIGPCYTKSRKWIVLEAKYTTDAEWLDQLTFTWHVLLETESATGNKNSREELPPYSYFTTTTTYANIPRGSHAASVCLHPSYLERYGEPKAIGLVIANANGEVLAGDAESMVKGIKSHTEFWKDTAIMDAKDAKGNPMIEQRQGLQDRSKTIWALVNPNDYEMVVQ